MRYVQLSGLASLLYYVYAGDRYLGVVSEGSNGLWQALGPAEQPIAGEFASCEAAGRGLTAFVCGTAPAVSRDSRDLTPSRSRQAEARSAPYGLAAEAM